MSQYCSLTTVKKCTEAERRNTKKLNRIRYLEAHRFTVAYIKDTQHNIILNGFSLKAFSKNETYFSKYLIMDVIFNIYLETIRYVVLVVSLPPRRTD